jgi:hypothetical protein
MSSSCAPDTCRLSRIAGAPTVTSASATAAMACAASRTASSLPRPAPAGPAATPVRSGASRDTTFSQLLDTFYY